MAGCLLGLLRLLPCTGKVSRGHCPPCAIGPTGCRPSPIKSWEIVKVAKGVHRDWVMVRARVMVRVRVRVTARFRVRGRVMVRAMGRGQGRGRGSVTADRHVTRHNPPRGRP